MPDSPYAIHYLPTWAGLGLLWCLSRLPYAWQLVIGRLLGRLLRRFGRRREHIAAVNLALCFPDMSAGARNQVITELFDSIGIGVMEMAMSWWAPDSKQLIYQSTDLSAREEFTIADASRPERPANVFPYPRAAIIIASAVATALTMNGR